MTSTIDVYYDFRSPYAYFAHARIIRGLFTLAGKVQWRWLPVSIDVLLNLQAGRSPWAGYIDPLAPSKRRYLVTDVIRSAKFYGIPLKAPRPARSYSIPALGAALALEQRGGDQGAFRSRLFEAAWLKQRDISLPETIAQCLQKHDEDRSVAKFAFSIEARRVLEERTTEAFARGVFGVPTFALDGELFFGADRMDMLAWRWNRASR